MVKCPDCNGAGEYVGFNTREECKPCRGTGCKNGMTDALKSVFDFNTFDDARPNGDPIKDSITTIKPTAKAGFSPQITIGTIIHIYDAGWFETEVMSIMSKMIYTQSPCNIFCIPANSLVWNATQNRWEHIEAGTPVWP